MLDVFDRYPDSDDSQDYEGVIEGYGEATALVEKTKEIPHEDELMSVREENQMDYEVSERMAKSFENWHKKLRLDLKQKEHKNLRGSSNSIVSVYRDAVYSYLISTNYDKAVTRIVIDLLDNWELKYFKPGAESRVRPEGVVDYLKNVVTNKINREVRIRAVISGLNRMGDSLGLDEVARTVFDKVRNLESTKELVEYRKRSIKLRDPFDHFFFLEKWYLISSYVFSDEFNQIIDRKVFDRAEVLGGVTFAKRFNFMPENRTVDQIRIDMEHDYSVLKETHNDPARIAITDFMRVIQIHSEVLHNVASATLRRKASKYAMKCLYDKEELDMRTFLAEIDFERHGEMGELCKPITGVLCGSLFEKWKPFQVLPAGAKRPAEADSNSQITYKRSKGFSQGKMQANGTSQHGTKHEKKENAKNNDQVLAKCQAQLKPRGNGITYPKPDGYRERDGFPYCEHCGGSVKGQAHCFDHTTGKALRPLKFAMKYYAKLDKKHTHLG
jgi:hypothetical protein